MKSQKAFTLIELLIVVAIIAILAAIAVPNFLEAQVRSKVSAAKAGLRTMATALESYVVDNNRYPYAETIGATPWLPPGGTPIQAPPGENPGGLTSPIAYLSSLPEDTFKHPIGNGISVVAPLYYEKAGFGYLNGVKTNMNVFVPADAVSPPSLLGTGADTNVPGANTTAIPENLTPERYVLYSIGPDMNPHLLAADGTTILSRSRYNLNNRYDPTNGTTSRGNILRFPGGISVP